MQPLFIGRVEPLSGSAQVFIEFREAHVVRQDLLGAHEGFEVLDLCFHGIDLLLERLLFAGDPSFLRLFLLLQPALLRRGKTGRDPGIIRRGAKCRLLRSGKIIYDSKIASLKRFKDDAKEVRTGFECGFSIENYNDVKVEDVVEIYEVTETKQTL